MSTETLPAAAYLDHQASTPTEPYVIITADCSSPREIDDGIFVEQLHAKKDIYRVGVCVVDASRLYEERGVVSQAMALTEAKYFQLPNDEHGYEPMIDPSIIKDLELTAPHVRDALIVSFTVGKKFAPRDLDISFGKVEVEANLSYQDFWKRYEGNSPERRFARASALIIQHLQFNSGGDQDHGSAPGQNFGDIFSGLLSGSRSEWVRGSRTNEAYMVAANHLVGSTLAAEAWPAIFRVHDPTDETHLEFMPPSVARYTRTPGRHQGLNLDDYCRVTSPLRRLEDFMMSYQLKQRSQGKQPTIRDNHEIAKAVMALNRRVIQQAAQDIGSLSKQDVLGKDFRSSIARFEGEPGGIVLPFSAESA